MKTLKNILKLAMIPILAGSLNGCKFETEKVETRWVYLNPEAGKNTEIKYNSKKDLSSNYKTENTNHDSTKKEGNVSQENLKEIEDWWTKSRENLNYENRKDFQKDLILSRLIRDNIERNMINNMNEDHRISPTEYLQWTYRDKFINYVIESVIQKKPHKKSKSKKEELSSEEYWWTKEEKLK